MAIINFATREITVKLVYFGPTDAGSNTNLRQLHKLVMAPEKSRLHRFGPGDAEERSYYFDFLSEASDGINGFRIHHRVYSLPGGLTLPAHRFEVLRDLDAVVFVADARAGREADNMDQLLALEELLAQQGLELASLPMVLQVNHIDHEEARPPNDVVFDLNPYGFPVVPAVATAPSGVGETLREVSQALAARIRDNMAGSAAAITLTAVHRTGRPTDEDIIRAHIEAIQAESSTTPASTLDSDTLTPARSTPSVEVSFQPPEFIGTHPDRVISARLEGNRVEVDVLMAPLSGGDPKPLRVILSNAPVVAPVKVDPVSPPVDHGNRVGDYLPESYTPPVESSPDLPPWLYGAIGVIGGIAIGALTVSLIGLGL